MSLDELETLSLASELSPTSRTRLANLGTIVAWPPQSLLFREGECHRYIYWIQQGRVRLEMSGTGGGAMAMLTVGPGDLLGWSALLGDQRMTATAITATATTLIALDADALQQLCDENHEIGYKVMQMIAKSISKRLLATRLQLLDLFQPPMASVDE